jgi:lysozyme|tara:strand:- start:1044 stop:1469 length:426 start_codon:yes stop_codon:yes gene_type:complete
MKFDMDKMIEQLVDHEGLELHPYEDSLGILTIGVGRNLEERGISEDEAFYLLGNDIEIIWDELIKQHPIVEDLDDQRQMILLDMAFNMGVPRLGKFKKMWAAIEDGDMIEASKQALDSRWADQVGRRAERLAERLTSGLPH